MQVEHSFTVAAGIDQAWPVITDLGFLAARVPGAKVASATPEQVDGTLKVKLGPLNLNYQGSVTLTDRDDTEHRATVRASGTDARNGTATSTTMAQAVADGTGTRVTLVTELELTGKPAQFGTTIMHEVGVRLVSQFQAKLAADLALEGSAEPPEVEPPVEPPEVERSAEPPGVEPPAAPPEVEPPADAEVEPGGTAVSLARRARPLVVKVLAPVALAAVVAAVAISRRRAG